MIKETTGGKKWTQDAEIKGMAQFFYLMFSEKYHDLTGFLLLFILMMVEALIVAIKVEWSNS